MSRQSKHDALAAYLTGRAIKLLANGLRPIFYCHYWLFPRQRYALKSTQKKSPSANAPVNCNGIKGRQIPPIIWQTNYTNRVSLPIKVAWICNRFFSGNHEYILHTSDDCLEFIQTHFPGRTTELYRRLTIGAAQADLWRLLTLYKYGGIYIDIDAHLVWPLSRIIGPETKELFVRYKNLEATNYFIASAPGNPTLKAIIDEVLHRIENSASNNVYEITGPSVLEYVLAQRDHHWRMTHQTCLQGNFSNKFFQYLDKPEGVWTEQQKTKSVVRGMA